MKYRILRPLALVLLLAALAAAQNVASFEKRITVKKLPNGLTILICERPEAPVFSFFTMVDAGSAQDPQRRTGLAHMFEHMAFKGTDTIGTTNYAAEKPALEKVEIAYAAYIAERDKTVGRDEARLKQLEKAWKDAIAEADKYVVAQPVRQDHRTERRRGSQRVHRLRRDRLPLLVARRTGWNCGPISSPSDFSIQ